MGNKSVRIPFDLVGDIAVIKVREGSMGTLRSMARVVMSTNKHVKTVLCQIGPVEGVFRTRKLKWVLGQRKTETTHREYGCVFNVDLSKVYFSPRLSYERARVAKLVQPDEVVVNMFAGIGPFSILIAKHSDAKIVYSIDINSEAVRYSIENARVNRVEDRVVPISGDAEKVIKERLQGVADRVLMPLPERAFEYLPSALIALKKGVGWVHYYDFTYAKKTERPVDLITEKVSNKLESLGVKFSIPFGRVVRKVGPNWYQVALDIKVKK